MRPTYALINTRALQHNIAKLHQLAPHSKIMAIVKANAYGHGLVQIASSLTNVDSLGVCSIDEAIQLRESGIQKPIVLLEGFFNKEELALVHEFNLESVLHSDYQIEMLEKTPSSKLLTIWLKINTGMHRLGFKSHQVLEILYKLRQCKKIFYPPRIISHFANANLSDDVFTNKQLEIINKLHYGFQPILSFANSAAILSYPESHFDWIRPGAILYGISPFSNQNAQDFNLLPVMTLCSKIIAIQEIAKNQAIGYGQEFRCKKDSRIGIVAIGYGDGYPRQTKEGTPILINGKFLPLVGKISMDMLFVDLTEDSNVKVGDEVILWGDGLPVEIIAQYSGLLVYELVCRVMQRVKRILV